MRDYGKVFSRIWESADFRSLSEDGRTLVMYLLTCQHGTIAGVFRIPDGYACEDLQWSVERVSQGFANLSANGFATRCEATKWVWVSKFLEWNPPENPNQRKSAAKVACSVPDQCAWKQAFMRVCGPLLGLDPEPKPEPLPNPPPTVPQPVSVTVAVTGTVAGTEERPARKRAAPPKPDDVAEVVWGDWLALRKAKRAPVTTTVVDAARAESVAAGMTLEAFLRVWCARGSQGLQADWLKPAERASPGRNGAPGPRKSDALMAGNIAAAQRFLEGTTP